MTAPPAFVGVDWGTSSFRLWLLDADGRVCAERRSQEGMAHAARAGFEAILAAHLDAVKAPGGLPVVICGMAGSRQGWKEARYLDVPVRLEALVDNAVRVGSLGRDMRILPGLAQRRADRPDVMRGEETQLLGAALLPPAQEGRTLLPDGLYCLPGTHSKWVCIDNGAVASFQTFMTGEIFALMAKQSILESAVDGAGPIDRDGRGFAEAVGDGLAQPDRLTAALFSIRGAQLLCDAQPARARARLSGLLIGAEIAGSGAAGHRHQTIGLIASGPLMDLYEAAFRTAGIAAHAIDAEAAVRCGLARAARAFRRQTEGSLTP